MDLTGNEYKLYNYLLDKWQNILSKNSSATEVLHSEGQIQIAKKLHMTRATVQNCLKSLEKKQMVEICCCKELGNINSYKMTDIAQSDCYKQLEATYKYEPKTKTKTYTSSGSGAVTRGARPTNTNTRGTALDYDRLLDCKQVKRMCGFLIDSSDYDFTFLDSLDLYRELNLSDFSSTTITIRQLVDYIKQRYNIDVPEQFLKV